MPLINYITHRRDCRKKQIERLKVIEALPDKYKSPLTREDVGILSTPVARLAAQVHGRAISPVDILKAYGKQALRAHAKTNCLTEIMILDAEHNFIPDSEKRGVFADGLLAGIPVSLKDTVHVAGWDSCIGYSRWVGVKAVRDAPITRLLKDAGAIPFVKTNVPITLLSFESTNDVFGRTSNPHNPKYSPGGSTGGESALLALGGSRIGVGTDVAGSVRIPAHYAGIYALRCSTGRFPKTGNTTSMAGQEGVNAVYSPMAKTMEDLTYFMRAVVKMEPWRYDHSVHPLPWRAVDKKWRLVPESDKETSRRRKVRFGVIRDDGVVPPSPACARALDMVVEAVRLRGDHVIELSDFPSAYEALKTAGILLNADGGKTFLGHFRSFFEGNDAGVSRLVFFFKLPSFIRSIYTFWVRHVRRDELWAGLLESWSEKTVAQQWELVVKREAIRAQWHRYWGEQEIDFILMPPHALPAVPERGMKNSVAACGYTFIWNLVDYTAGVLPVTHVDKRKDALPADFSCRSMNAIAKGAYSYYDAEAMHGLPVGVQIVGQRLEEEKVLAGMERIEEALGRKAYSTMSLDFEL